MTGLRYVLRGAYLRCLVVTVGSIKVHTKLLTSSTMKDLHMPQDCYTSIVASHSSTEVVTSACAGNNADINQPGTTLGHLACTRAHCSFVVFTHMLHQKQQHFVSRNSKIDTHTTAHRTDNYHTPSTHHPDLITTFQPYFRRQGCCRQQ